MTTGARSVGYPVASLGASYTVSSGSGESGGVYRMLSGPYLGGYAGDP